MVCFRKKLCNNFNFMKHYLMGVNSILRIEGVIVILCVPRTRILPFDDVLIAQTNWNFRQMSELQMWLMAKYRRWRCTQYCPRQEHRIFVVSWTEKKVLPFMRLQIDAKGMSIYFSTRVIAYLAFGSGYNNHPRAEIICPHVRITLFITRERKHIRMSFREVGRKCSISSSCNEKTIFRTLGTKKCLFTFWKIFLNVSNVTHVNKIVYFGRTLD